MKVYDLNTNQIAMVATQEEFDQAEQIMLADGKYSTNITMVGDMVKAFIWGISDDVKNKLYAMAGVGQGVTVEGVQPDTFKMPEKTVDPALEQKVDEDLAEMQAKSASIEPVQEEAQQNPAEQVSQVQQPQTVSNPLMDKIKAVTQNAYTYCAAAYVQLYTQLYNQQCPEINTQEFAAYVNWLTQSWMTMAEQGQDMSQWMPWIDYIYNVGTAAYKNSRQA